VTIPRGTNGLAEADLIGRQALVIESEALAIDTVVADSGNSNELGEASIAMHSLLLGGGVDDGSWSAAVAATGRQTRKLFTEPVMTVVARTRQYDPDATDPLEDDLVEVVSRRQLNACLEHERAVWQRRAEPIPKS
jgi:hypothetical protein